jgi:hypothetical protein
MTPKTNNKPMKKIFLSMNLTNYTLGNYNYYSNNTNSKKTSENHLKSFLKEGIEKKKKIKAIYSINQRFLRVPKKLKLFHNRNQRFLE